MNIDRIKRKIAKLLNLANGTSNEHEARNAMMKAARLMNSFGVKEGDCTFNKIVEIEKAFGTRKVAKAHEQMLFWNICETMGVFGLYTTATKQRKNWRGEVVYEGTPCSFTCVGRESDIEIAWYMFEVSLNEIQKQTAAYSLGRKLKRSELTSYAGGLMAGLSRRFKVMRTTANDEAIGTGLVPVDTRKKDAEAFYKEGGGTSITSTSSINETKHTSAGIQDSDAIVINAGVNGTKTKQTLRLS